MTFHSWNLQVQEADRGNIKSISDYLLFSCRKSTIVNVVKNCIIEEYLHINSHALSELVRCHKGNEVKQREKRYILTVSCGTTPIDFLRLSRVTSWIFWPSIFICHVRKVHERNERKAKPILVIKNNQNQIISLPSTHSCFNLQYNQLLTKAKLDYARKRITDLCCIHSREFNLTVESSSSTYR